MNNNMNTPRVIRRRLLSTVSALALLGLASGANASASDADHPQVWIELGGQAEHMSGQGELFVPAFLAANAGSPVLGPTTPLQAQKPPEFDFGEEGQISFKTENWSFSVGARIGRSSNFRHVDHQTKGVFDIGYQSGIPTTIQNLHGTDDFSDTQVHRKESHTILDFQIGRDVGLGLFGRNGSSTLNLGVRFAQFVSNTTVDIRARPDLHFKYKTLTSYGYPSKSLKLPYFHTYHATGSATRSFHGIGPSLSWTGSVPFVGSPQNGELTFDWGAAAALLFGRQKAHVQHQESAHYQTGFIKYNALVYQHPPAGHDTNRSVVVPNIGGSIGLSWRVENFKLSAGYRADLFFNAMDVGIDARKSNNVGLYGPFANVSVALGG